jgi:uncharacterized membrane protein YidH (DUF202 family)
VSEPAEAKPGLQRERTALAWDRTGLALMVTGTLLVRVGEAPYAHIRHLPGYLAVAVGLGLVVHAERRYYRRIAAGDSDALVSPGLARLTGLVVTLLGLAALVIIVVEH